MFTIRLSIVQIYIPRSLCLQFLKHSNTSISASTKHTFLLFQKRLPNFFHHLFRIITKYFNLPTIVSWKEKNEKETKRYKVKLLK